MCTMGGMKYENQDGRRKRFENDAQTKQGMYKEEDNNGRGHMVPGLSR